jgi:hypothetical protein
MDGGSEEFTWTRYDNGVWTENTHMPGGGKECGSDACKRRRAVAVAGGGGSGGNVRQQLLNVMAPGVWYETAELVRMVPDLAVQNCRRLNQMKHSGELEHDVVGKRWRLK